MTRREHHTAKLQAENKALQATNEALRKRITLLEEELKLSSSSADGEFTIFLSDHHTQLLLMLYNAQALSLWPNYEFWRGNPNFQESLEVFVESALDFALYRYLSVKEARKRKRAENFFKHN